MAAKINAADLVYDGSLRNTLWASKVIDKALHKGWTVHVGYVQRPMELTAPDFIARTEEEGRSGPTSELPRTATRRKDLSWKSPNAFRTSGI